MNLRLIACSELLTADLLFAGRSIGMVEGLLAKKSGIMPWPAAIITAVGTKVFLFDVATRQWTPDPAYSALLDDGWNLQEVSQGGLQEKVAAV